MDLDILFLTKPIPDYMHDMLHLGLWQFGCNVVDIPTKPSLHGWPHPSQYSYDHLTIITPQAKFRKLRPDIMIVTASAHDTSYFADVNAWKTHVITAYEYYKPARVVLLDGQDNNEYDYPALPYSCIFKREFTATSLYSNVHPIWLAPLPERVYFRPFHERLYHMAYIATVSNPARKTQADMLIDLAKKLNLKLVIHLSNSHVARNTYLDLMSDSLLNISSRGMGYDCYRHWETPYHGTVLVRDLMPQPIHNDFDDSMIFSYKDTDELAFIIEKTKNMGLSDLEGMALKAMHHINKYHTPLSRAKYFIEKIYEK